MEQDLMPSTPKEGSINYNNILMTFGCGIFAEMQLAKPHPHSYSSSCEEPAQEQNQRFQHHWGGIKNPLAHPNIIKLLHRIDTTSDMRVIMEHVAGEL